MAGDYLNQLHADESSKLHAILMGAAASGIAFALHENNDRPLAWDMAPILAAIICWGLSFASGVLSRRKLMQAIKSNILMNEAIAEHNTTKHQVSQLFVTKHGDRALTYQDCQEWLLLIGVVLYISGHTWHLSELSVPIKPPAEALATPNPQAAAKASPPPIHSNTQRH